jgi:chorismate synthase
MSIPSVKGLEIGDGFAAAGKRGSQVHDRITRRSGTSAEYPDRFVRRSNRAGGIEGGMTNGEELVIRAACKPISTLPQPLDTVDIDTKQKTEAIVERTDVCVVPAAAVIGEAMAAMTLASAFTDKFGNDAKSDIDAAFDAYMNREF